MRKAIVWDLLEGRGGDSIYADDNSSETKVLYPLYPIYSKRQKGCTALELEFYKTGSTSHQQLI